MLTKPKKERNSLIAIYYTYYSNILFCIQMLLMFVDCQPLWWVDSYIFRVHFLKMLSICHKVSNIYKKKYNI